ncbi:MAG: DUF1566 domain-containing protein [Kiritimatiellales bacterium]
MKKSRITLVLLSGAAMAAERPYVVVGTGQTKCYDNRGEIAPPQAGRPFYGQDAQYPDPVPDYKDNGDGTVSDLNTGLIWVKARGEKISWDAAVAGAKACRVGGYDDWRMPTIKELYSLINFNGGCAGTAASSTPYLDTKYFDFVYGDESKGIRIIDCQDWSATEYIGKTMRGNTTAFGVNFADGRIKGYPKSFPNGKVAAMYVRYVRGKPDYGKNDFKENGDGTVTDLATGLMWQQTDSGKGMNWQEALAWVQEKNAENYLGHNDWRLPDAKELQSIVNYSSVPAINQNFLKMSDTNAWYWTGTSHLEGPADRRGSAAVYIAFGKATGWMKFPPTMDLKLIDVHGAGAQRSDPKVGNPADYPHGRGPQGDVIRINNFVRLVR